MNHEHALYTDLLTLLREMLSHYHRLLELTQREQETLTAASLPTFLEMTTQKEILILELSVMEEGRQLLLRKLAEQLDTSPAELTLRALSQLAPEPLAVGFHRCRTDLVALIQAIEQVNAQKTMLLSSSLDCVRTSLRLISQLLEPAAIYGHSGHLDATRPGGRVLHRQV
jgi:flagellar biosynthesis/type III secretory pathway chaperone